MLARPAFHGQPIVYRVSAGPCTRMAASHQRDVTDLDLVHGVRGGAHAHRPRLLNHTGGLRSLTERLTPSAPINAHEHAHAHEGASHRHLHGHGSNRGLVATFGRHQSIRPVVVGLVHGLAGSAAVALLVLATIQDTGNRRLQMGAGPADAGPGRSSFPTHGSALTDISADAWHQHCSRAASTLPPRRNVRQSRLGGVSVPALTDISQQPVRAPAQKPPSGHEGTELSVGARAGQGRRHRDGPPRSYVRLAQAARHDDGISRGRPPPPDS